MERHPFLSTMKWVLFGVFIGLIMFLAWSALSGGQQAENDAALDAEAARHGAR